MKVSSMGRVGRGMAVANLERLLASGEFNEGDQLPAERELATRLQVSRGTLRQALAALENEGRIWRRMGQGTFVGRVAPGNTDQLASQLASLSNPMEVTEVRLLIEPRLAALAAMRGTQQSFVQLQQILQIGLESCTDPEKSHYYNEQLHLTIAKTARNRLLQGLFETLFQVRTLTSWGKLQSPVSSMAQRIEIWAQHKPIVEAIVNRDAREAAHLMRQHIEEVHRAISTAQDAWISRTSP